MSTSRNIQAETRREIQEGNLARLGNALVYLGLIRERVKAAGQPGLLFPALEDIQCVEALILRTQQSIAKDTRTVAAESSEFSSRMSPEVHPKHRRGGANGDTRQDLNRCSESNLCTKRGL